MDNIALSSGTKRPDLKTVTHPRQWRGWQSLKINPHSCTCHNVVHRYRTTGLHCYSRAVFLHVQPILCTGHTVRLRSVNKASKYIGFTKRYYLKSFYYLNSFRCRRFQELSCNILILTFWYNTVHKRFNGPLPLSILPSRYGNAVQEFCIRIVLSAPLEDGWKQ